MNRNEKATGKRMIAKASAATLALAMSVTSVPGSALPVLAADTQAEAQYSTSVARLKAAAAKLTLTTKKTIYKKDKIKVVAKNSANLKIAGYKSSNSKIVSVDKKGYATAKKAGSAKITVTYYDSNNKKKSVSVKLTVKEAASMNSLKLAAGADATKAIKLVDSKAKITKATSSDAKIIKVNKNGTVTPLKAGTATVKFYVKTRNGATVTYDKKYTVAKKAVTKIAISKKPTKVEYIQGEEFKSDGLSVKVTYNNGKTATVSASKVKVTGFDTNKTGTQKLTVTYEGKTTTFTVTVKEAAVKAAGITVKNFATDLTVGQSWADIKEQIKVYTIDENQKELADVTADAKINDSAVDTSKAGSYTVTITYGDFKYEATVTVKEADPVAPKAVGIIVTGAPQSLVQGADSIAALQNLKVYTIDENHNQIEDVTAKSTIPDIDTTTAGDKTVIVSYGSFTASFTVKVIEKAPEEDKEPVNIKITATPDTIPLGTDPSQVAFTVVTIDKDGKAIEDVTEKATIDKLDTSTLGEKTITVTYDRFSAFVKVKVTAPVVAFAKLTVTGVPASIDFGADWDAIKKNIVVTAVDADGKNATTVTDAVFSTVDTKKAGKQTVTVTSPSYEGIQGTFDVNVAEEVISVKGVKATLSQTTFNTADSAEYVKEFLTVQAVMSNDTLSDKLAASEYEVTGFDFTEGEHELVVTYQGYTDKVSYTVTADAQAPKTITASLKADVVVKVGTAAADVEKAILEQLEVKGFDAEGKEIGAVDLKDITLDGIDTQAPVEEQTITVSYKGTSITTTVKIKVEKADAEAPTIVSGTTDGYQKLVVTFSEPVAKTTGFAVKVNDTDETANAVLSEDGLTLTITREAGFKAGTYTVAVEGVQDASENTIDKTTATTKITKAASTIKEFNFVSSAVADSYNYNADGTIKADQTEGQLKLNSTDVYFTATDQFGQEIELTQSYLNNVEATATIGTYPLDVVSIKADTNGKGIVTIGADSALKAGATLSLKLEAKDADGNVIAEQKKDFEVKKRLEVAKAKTLDSIKLEKGSKELDPEVNNTVELKAILSNEFGPVTGTDDEIKWQISDTTKVIFADDKTEEPENRKNNTKVSGDKSVKFEAISQGTVTITAYLTSDITQSKTFTLEIGNTPLSELKLDAPADTMYNNEDLKFGITANTGAALKAGDLKYKIVSKPEGAEDPSVTLADDATTANKVNATVQTSTAGAYTITYYEGTTFEDAKVKLNSTFTTKVNPSVDTIEAESVEQLPKGTVTKKPIVFKNVHGEEVSVKLADIKPAAKKVAVTFYDVDDKEVTDPTSEAKIKKIGLKPLDNAEENDTYTVTLSVGTSKQLRLSGTIAKKAELDKVTLGTDKLDVIKDDYYDADKDEETPTNDVVLVGNKAYKLVKVGFADQYGNEMTKNEIKSNKSTVETAHYSVKFFGENKEEIKDETTGIAYIGIHAEAEAAKDTSLTIFNDATDEKDKKTLATLSLSPLDARTIKTVTADQTQAAVLTTVSAEYILTAKDQYGDPIVINSYKPENSDYQTMDQQSVLKGKMTLINEGENAGGLKVELESGEAGNYSTTIHVSNQDTYPEDGTGAKDILLRLNVYNQVDITSIQIDPNLVVGDKITDASNYYVKDGVTYTVSTKAFDTANTEVKTNSDFVGYKVLSIMDKDGNSKSNQTEDQSAGFVTFENDQMTVKGLAKDDVVTIQAIANNGKDATLTFKVDTSAEKITNGTRKLVAEKAGKDNPTDWTVQEAGKVFNASEATDADKKPLGYTKVSVIGVDQYGHDMVDTKATVKIVDDTIAKVSKVENGIVTITARKAGDTTIVVRSDTDEIEIPFHVSDDAVKKATAN
ncbi:MAG: bacterial Ig-like domain-containing protein [Lachnospiraceae bacterium]